MGSTLSKTRTIRIKNETEAYFKDKPLNKYVDSLYEHVIGGEIELLDDGIGVHTNKQVISSEIMKDIESMCRFFDTSVGDFMEKLCDAMNEGKVSYSDGEIVVQNPDEVDLSRFREACDAKGVPYQKMIDKATQNVWGS